MMELPEIIRVVKENPYESITVRALLSLVKILRLENPPTDEVIRSGIVTNLVAFLEDPNAPFLERFACSTLITITGGTYEHTQHVIDQGAIPHFIRLLKSPSYKIVECAATNLGNIVRNGLEATDKVLKEGGLETLISIVYPHITLPMLQKIMWAACYLCRYEPPKERVRRSSLRLFASYLTHDDSNVIEYSCIGLTSLTYFLPIQQILDHDVVSNLVELLGHPKTVVVKAVLRAVSRILAGIPAYAVHVIKEGGIRALKLLLLRLDSSVVKGAMICLCELGSTAKHLQSIVDHEILSPIRYHLINGDAEPQKYAAYFICHFIMAATKLQIDLLIYNDIIPPFCDLLQSEDARVVSSVLNGIHNIILKAEADRESHKFTKIIEHCGGADKLKAVSQRQELGNLVCDHSAEIINKYFGEKDGQVDEAKEECA